MARSLRSSRRKENKTRLRKTVFEKVELDRNDRLSAKLLEIAKAPKPSKSQDVDMDTPGAAASKNTKAMDHAGGEDQGDAMALDKPKSTKRIPAKGYQSRIGKRRKTSKGIVFPVGKKHSPSKQQPRKQKG